MRLLKQYMIAALIGFFAASCSGSDEEQGQEDGLEGQQEDEYADQDEYSDNSQGNDYQANEGGEGDNEYAEGNEYGNEDGEGDDEGQYVNNAGDEGYGEDFAGEDGEGLNNVPVEDEADQMVNDILGANAAAGQSANELPQDGFADSGAPAGNGIVKYAAASVSVLDQPNGSIIGQLQQGDHPLVYDEGEFSRLFDGRYVGANDLSNQGIGRPRDQGMWQ